MEIQKTLRDRAGGAGTEEVSDERVRRGGGGAMLGQEECAHKEWMAGQFYSAHGTFLVGRSHTQRASAQSVDIIGIHAEVAEVFFFHRVLTVNFGELRAGREGDRHGATRE